MTQKSCEATVRPERNFSQKQQQQQNIGSAANSRTACLCVAYWNATQKRFKCHIYTEYAMATTIK